MEKEISHTRSSELAGLGIPTGSILTDLTDEEREALPEIDMRTLPNAFKLHSFAGDIPAIIWSDEYRHVTDYYELRDKLSVLEEIISQVGLGRGDFECKVCKYRDTACMRKNETWRVRRCKFRFDYECVLKNIKKLLKEQDRRFFRKGHGDYIIPEGTKVYAKNI